MIRIAITTFIILASVSSATRPPQQNDPTPPILPTVAPPITPTPGKLPPDATPQIKLPRPSDPPKPLPSDVVPPIRPTPGAVRVYRVFVPMWR